MRPRCHEGTPYSCSSFFIRRLPLRPTGLRGSRAPPENAPREAHPLGGTQQILAVLRHAHHQLTQTVRQGQRLTHCDRQHLMTGLQIRAHQIESLLKTAAALAPPVELGIGIAARQRYLLPQPGKLLAGWHIPPDGGSSSAAGCCAGWVKGRAAGRYGAPPLARQLPVALGQLIQQRLLLGAQGHAARRSLGHGGPTRLELGDKRLAQKLRS